MTRSRASARAAGTRAERAVADYLRDHLADDRIDRRVRHGAKDRGDIGGVRTTLGERVVIEVKDHAKLALAEWVQEAEVERGNDDATAAVVVHKRRGKSDPADWYVTCTLQDLAVLLGADRTR